MKLFSFIDHDECSTLACPSHSTCINTPGSYQCSCDYGYVKNGVSCQGNYYATVCNRIHINLVL